jgi:hypothetical protein
MLKYRARLQSVGVGEACSDRSNHFAHERIVFQAHSSRNGLLKREPDIVGANAGRDRHEGFRTLLRHPAHGFETLILPHQGEVSDKALGECMSGADGFAGWITGHARLPLRCFTDFGYVMRFLHLVPPEFGWARGRVGVCG